VAIVLEREQALTGGLDVNGVRGDAHFLGTLATDEKSGDEDHRLGFEVHGHVSPDAPDDVDFYGFEAVPGTEIWIDLDRTAPALDARLELYDPLGGLVASHDYTAGFGLAGQTLIENQHLGGDFYTLNYQDPGIRVVLPGSANQAVTYFVRVASTSGQVGGEYQLQARLRQVDEFPGSTIHYADIRYATTGIDVSGLPSHSPLVGETTEVGDAANTYSATGPQDMGNLLVSERNVISAGGNVASVGDVDWYRFDLSYTDLHSSDSNSRAAWSTIFDLDYADELLRPDSTLAVFDSAGQLVYVGRESNVADDRAAPGEGLDLDDLA